MAFSLMAICALIVAFRYLSAWYRMKKEFQKADLRAEDNELLAEIEGKTWPQLSVFEHIERGLKKNPQGPAVVCLMEQSSSVQKLVAACSEAGEENTNNDIHSPCLTPTLWSKDRSRIHPPNSIEDIPPDSPAREVKKTAFTLTYTQLHHTALKVATGLLAVGVQPNTNMIMLIPNGAEYAILLWACILLRITYINLDPGALDISGFTALKQTIKIIRPQLVVVPDAYSGKAIDVAISELGLPQPVRVYLSDSSGVSTGWKSLLGVATHVNCHDFSDSASIVSAARRRDMTRINSIMFTSGTSGMPKGCPQSVAAISHALNSQEWLIDSDSGAAKYALMQPHNSRGIAPAQTLQTWRAGGAIVLTGQSFSVHDAIKAIDQLGASFLVLTPPMVHEFASALATVSLDLSCVKRIQIGGDAVTKDVLVRCAALFPQAQICVNQGMTEGPGVFTWPFLETGPRNIPYFGDQICPVGVVAPGARIRLRSTTCDGVVKRGEIGELHISCPSIIRCYLGGYSEDVFYNDTKGRWFNTKDMAMVDNQGLVFIMGRRRDMITRAGVTIAPAVIESCIANFTQSQAVVVPVPHSVLGAEPIAVVDSLTNFNITNVKQHVKITLGEDYALGGVVCLKQLGFVDFPVNATHKIIKSELQEAVLRYWKLNQNGLATREEKAF